MKVEACCAGCLTHAQAVALYLARFYLSTAPCQDTPLTLPRLERTSPQRPLFMTILWLPVPGQPSPLPGQVAGPESDPSPCPHSKAWHTGGLWAVCVCGGGTFAEAGVNDLLDLHWKPILIPPAPSLFLAPGASVCTWQALAFWGQAVGLEKGSPTPPCLCF